MDAATELRNEITRVLGIAQRALEVANKTSAAQQSHSLVCLEIQKNNETQQRNNEKFQDEQRETFRQFAEQQRDGLKLLGGAWEQGQTDASMRQDKFISVTNDRIASSIKTAVDGMGAGMTNIQQSLSAAVNAAAVAAKTTADSLAAFMTAQAAVNASQSALTKANSDQLSSLTQRVSGSIILTLLAIIGALFAKLMHWW